MKRPYDSTVARIAGNILSGSNWFQRRQDGLVDEDGMKRLAAYAVWMARAIVAECERSEPREEPIR